MERQPVSSSQIRSIGYDAPAQVLEIEFIRKGAPDSEPGAVYQYFDVPDGAHKEFINADSIGRHFGKFFKGVYRYARVDAVSVEL